MRAAFFVNIFTRVMKEGQSKEGSSHFDEKKILFVTTVHVCKKDRLQLEILLLRASSSVIEICFLLTIGHNQLLLRFDTMQL